MKILKKVDKKNAALTDILKSDIDKVYERAKQDMKRKIDVSERLSKENFDS